MFGTVYDFDIDTLVGKVVRFFGDHRGGDDDEGVREGVVPNAFDVGMGRCWEVELDC